MDPSNRTRLPHSQKRHDFHAGVGIAIFSKQFVIEADASGGGIGAVLQQDHHHIAFISKALSNRHLALSVYDKEMMAAVFAIQSWHPYLIGQRFKYLLEQRLNAPTQHLWLVKLLGYNFEIEQRPGSLNSALDALSHRHELLTIMGLSTPIFYCLDDLQQACLIDPEASHLHQQLLAGSSTKKRV